MIEFLTADGNLPFAVALMVMLLIALLEVIAILLGGGLSGPIDSLLPVHPGAEVLDFSTETSLSRLLGWLRFGQVPALMLLVVFLTGFGLSGLAIQSVAHDTAGFLLPGWIAALPAFLCAMPLTRWIAGLLGRVMPRDETDAVSEQSFIGLIATVTLGTAQLAKPAQAKLRDLHGQTHYVLVQPDTSDESFITGTKVLLVSQKGAVFNAIRNPHPVLTD